MNTVDGFNFGETEDEEDIGTDFESAEFKEKTYSNNDDYTDYDEDYDDEEYDDEDFSKMFTENDSAEDEEAVLRNINGNKKTKNVVKDDIVKDDIVEEKKKPSSQKSQSIQQTPNDEQPKEQTNGSQAKTVSVEEPVEPEPEKQQPKQSFNSTTTESQNSYSQQSEDTNSNQGTAFKGDVILEEDTKKYDWLHLNNFFIGLSRGCKVFISFSIMLCVMVLSAFIITFGGNKERVSANSTTEQTDFLTDFNSEPFADLIPQKINTQEATTQVTATEEASNLSETPMQETTQVVQGSNKFSSLMELTLYIQKAAATVGEKQYKDVQNLVDGYISREECLNKMNTYSLALDELSKLLILNQSLYSNEEYQSLSSLVSKQVQFCQKAISMLENNEPLSDIEKLLAS